MGLTSFQGSLYVAVYKVSGESGKLFKSEDGENFNSVNGITEGVHSLDSFQSSLYVGTWTTTGSNNTGKLYNLGNNV